jgi:hypothetical protein
VSAGPLDTDYLLVGALVALIAVGVYFRVRRTLGRQPYAPRRMRARIVILGAIGAMLVASLPTPSGFGAAALGSAAGLGLAVFGLRHTKFEKTDAGLFFTPNRWVGLGVTALFVGRLAVRLMTAFRLAEETALSGDPPLEHMHRSPLTLAFYFLFAGYYAGYYALLLRRPPLISADGSN